MSKFLVKSFFWVTVSEVIYNASSYVIHAGMGRILGPAEYGRYGLVITLTTMVVVLIGQGVPTAMAKYLGEIYDTNIGLIPIIKRQTARIQFFLIGGVTVLFFLLSPLIAEILNDATLTPLFRLSSLVIPAFALASFYFYYYTGLHQFGKQALLKTSRSFFRILFILGLAFLLRSKGYALEGAIVGYILAPLSIFFEANILDKYKKAEAKGEFDWRKLLNYAWPMTLFLIAYEFLITIDLYLVKGILKNDVLTGLYNGAITVGRLPYFLFYALTIILLPAVSKSTSSENHADTKRLVSESLRLMVMFLVPMAILMSAYAGPILKIFYGNKFMAAAAPMSVLMAGVVFLTVFYILAFILNGAGKVKAPMVISFVGLIANIILSFFLIKKYALLGAATATSITSFLVMMLSLFYTYRFFGYLFKWSSFLKIILTSALLYLAAHALPAVDWKFLPYSLALMAFYLLSLFVVRELGGKEIEILKRLLKRKKTGKFADEAETE